MFRNLSGKTGVAVRLSIVLGCLILIHVVARATSYFEVSGNNCYDDYGMFDTCAATHWYGYYGNGFGDFILYHFLGLLIAAIVVLVVWLIFVVLFLILGYIMGWKLPRDEDPCQDPKCPCKRHVVERENAERRRQIATAAIAGGIVGGIVGGS